MTVYVPPEIRAFRAEHLAWQRKIADWLGLDPSKITNVGHGEDATTQPYIEWVTIDPSSLPTRSPFTYRISARSATERTVQHFRIAIHPDDHADLVATVGPEPELTL